MCLHFSMQTNFVPIAANLKVPKHNVNVRVSERSYLFGVLYLHFKSYRRLAKAIYYVAQNVPKQQQLKRNIRHRGTLTLLPFNVST